MGDRRPVGDVQPFAELSRSATTVVYKGYQQSLDRFVLLKRLRADVALDEGVDQRFKDEARLVARIQHPNVVAIFAYGEDDLSPYLVAEYVEGVDLAELLDAGPLPVELAFFVLREVARGLGAAHDRGIIHRYVKPAIMLLSHGGLVKVGDFGMASVGDTHPEVRGTMPYLAPEQITGVAPSPSSDFFSLGATFFEMLTGRRAFLGGDTTEIFENILHYDPVPSLAARSSLPAECVVVCGKLIARHPEDRYASWKEIEAETTDYLNSLPVQIDAADLSAFIDDRSSYRPVDERTAAKHDDAEPAAVRDREPTPSSERPRRVVPTAFAAAMMIAVALAIAFIFWPRGFHDDLAPGDRLAQDTEYPLWLHPSDDTAFGRADNDDLDDGVANAGLMPLPPRVDAPTTGWLRIRTDPRAVVVIGDDTLGRTPLSEAVLKSAGFHRLVLLHPDFPSHQQQVQVRPGETTELFISMWDNVGRLTVEVSPWASVWIDGRERETVPPQTEPFILTPGNHRLLLRHPELGDYHTTVSVDAGESKTLRYNLYELLGD